MIKIILILLALLTNLSSNKKATVNKDKSLDKHCIDCHVVYYPEFLPKRSWELLFKEKNLNNHFGDKVVLENGIKQMFLKYYLKYASDNKKNSLSKKVNRSIPKSKTPLRITKTAYYKDKHEDLKDEMVIKNKKVLSYSNCKACHGEEYKKGVFDEDEVDIPNWKKGIFGWDKI